MHSKFIKTGGTIRRALHYLLGERDHKGKIRPVVKVMRGDPEQIAALGRAIENDPKRKSSSYASAVISWAPEDRPTPKEKKEVVDEFIKMAAAGMENDVASLAVDHGDHVHVIFIKQNLRTGHAWNPAAPGWQKWTDPIRDRWNEAKGWKSPDIEAHPENARIVNLAAHNLPKKVVEAKRKITERAMRAIDDGIITDRASMIAWLKRGGAKISRERKRTISVFVPEHKTPLKLEGVIYEREFRPERVRETLRRAREARERVDREAREKKLAKLTKAAKSVYRSRAKYHRKRFASKKVGSGRRRREDREQANSPAPANVRADRAADEPLWLAVLDWNIPAPSPVAPHLVAVAGWSVQRPEAGPGEDRQRVVSGERDTEKLLEGVTNDRVRAALSRSERAISAARGRADRRESERPGELHKQIKRDIPAVAERVIEREAEREAERLIEQAERLGRQLEALIAAYERVGRELEKIGADVRQAEAAAERIAAQIVTKAAKMYGHESGVRIEAEIAGHRVEGNKVYISSGGWEFGFDLKKMERDWDREREPIRQKMKQQGRGRGISR